MDAVVTVVKDEEERDVWGMNTARMRNRRGTRNQCRSSEENAGDCLRGVRVPKWGVIQVTFCGLLDSLSVLESRGGVKWRAVLRQQVVSESQGEI